MTTTATHKKPLRKPRRIRPELLPDSATYGTFDGREYVMIPVEDFGDWYEDVEDGAVVAYARDNPEPIVPAEEVKAGLRQNRRSAKK